MVISTTVELKIDEKTLAEAAEILERVGLTVSGALSLTLEEIVRARYFQLPTRLSLSWTWMTAS